MGIAIPIYCCAGLKILTSLSRQVVTELSDTCRVGNCIKMNRDKISTETRYDTSMLVHWNVCVPILSLFSLYSVTCANDHLSPAATSLQQRKIKVPNKSPLSSIQRNLR